MKTITVHVLNKPLFSLRAPLKLADPTDAYRKGDLNVRPQDRVPHADKAPKMKREEFAEPVLNKKTGKWETKVFHGYASNRLGGFVRR